MRGMMRLVLLQVLVLAASIMGSIFLSEKLRTASMAFGVVIFVGLIVNMGRVWRWGYFNRTFREKLRTAEAYSLSRTQK